MNARGPGGRGRRPERENTRSEPKPDSERLKNDMKSDGPRDRGKSLDKSPPRGRFDPRRDTRIPGKPRDRDGKQVFKRKEPGRNPNFKGGKYEIASRSHHLDHPHYRDHRDRDGYRERESYRSSSHDHGMKPEGKPFCDDTRLSKLVRRVQREDERDRKISALRQLKEFFDQTENSKVICQNAHALMGVFMAIFKEGRCPREVRQEAASCLAILGLRLNEDSQKYVQWVFSEFTSAPNDEIKVLLLSSLIQALKEDDGKGSLTNLVQMILTSCQNVLEDADVPELLMAVVDVILHITVTYPDAFASHFTDTVDILVGWHIDATQGPAICQYTSDALVTFHEFWVADMNFSLTLLGQFLEDMEAYTEDLVLGLSGQNVTEEDMPLPEECVIKIAALFRVFNTVLKSLGDHFSPEKESSISWEFVEDTIDRLVKCVDNSNRNLYSEEVLTEATRCLLLMVQGLKSDASKAQASLLPFVDEQFTAGPQPTETFITTFLDLLKQVLVTMSTQLPVHFIQDFLAASSSTMRLRFHYSSQVVSQLVGVVEAVFNIKSVPIMEEAYRYIVGDLEVALNQLIGPFTSAEPLHLISDNPHVETRYSRSQAETVCLFSICILAEIGNAKNNLIVMWALSPSVFELLAKHLIPAAPDVMQRYPTVQYSFLRALHSHSTKHNNFISNSDLLSPSSGREGSVLGNVNSATARHLVVLIELLSSLLKRKKMDPEIRAFILKWSLELIEGLQDTQQIYVTATFTAYIQALLDLGSSNSANITVGVASCLQAYMRLAKDVSDEIQDRVLTLCSRHLKHVDPSVRESYQALLPLISAPQALKESGLLVSSSCHPLHHAWLTRRAYMARTPSGTFHSHNFRAIMARLLNSGGHSLSDELPWLQKMYSTSQRTDKDKTANSDYWNKNALQDAGLLWLWATWETAQFCILSKLRTPLGKPQDTFTTIEAGLKKYSAEIRHLETDQVKVLTADDNKESSSDEFGSSLRASLLLQFMENLEKLLYNAYEGLANALPAPPKAARTFFRTNRGTCQEWLLRVRLHVVVMALHCGQPAMAYRHAAELLRDMKDSGKHQTPELETVLMHAVTALVQLRCPEAILGLYAWAKSVTGTRHTWIKAAADMALSRYENAVNGFQSCLRSLLAPDPNIEDLSPDSPMPSPSCSPKFRPDGTPKLSILTKNTPIPPPAPTVPPPNPALANYMVDQVCKSYVNLHQWEEVVAWQQTLQQYRSEHSDTPLQKAFYMHEDLNYIKALSDFKLGDYPSVREHLELVPGGTLSEGALLDPPQLTVAWDVQLLGQAAQRQLIRVATQLQTAEEWKDEMSAVRNGLRSCENLCESLLRVGSLCWPSQLDCPVMVLRQTAQALQHMLEGQELGCGLFSYRNSSTKLHPLDTRLSVALQAYDAARMLDAVQKVCGKEGAPAPVGSLRMLVTRLARKSSNLKLSEQLLISQLSSYGCQEVEGSAGLRDMLTSVSQAEHQQNHVKLLHIEREGAKLLYAQGEQHSAIELMGAAVATQLQAHVDTPPSADDAELASRSLLTVTQWLQADNKLLTAVLGQLGMPAEEGDLTESGLARSIGVLMEMEKNPPPTHLESEELGGVRIVSNPVLPEADELAGRLLHLSTQHCPNLAKAWFSLASWGYKWGRKALDNASHGTVSLSTDEKAKVMSLLPQGTPSSEVEAVMGVLSQVHVGASNEEDITDTDQLLYGDDAETTRNALLGCCLSLQITSDACVERLLDVWREVVHRVYNYYQLAAKAYFTYLQLNTQGYEDLSTADGHTTATLRLLRLLVKHAWELRDVLEDGLAHTPTQPWKGIIPQLFSRLNHPEAYVRNSIAELLCRVAQDSPHLIVYPAVVGCAVAPNRAKMEPQGGLLNDYLQGGEDDTEVNSDDHDLIPADDDLEGSEDSTQNMLQDCFKSITDSLAAQNPSLISEVQALVSELRRVTLLWDELWLGTLNQHHADVTRRTTQLDNEIRRVVNNEDLSEEDKETIIMEKHKTILKPTLYAMERLHAITGRAIDTPHELWFHETYGAMLEAALERLRHPPNPRNPHSSWSGFKQIHRNLQDRSAKRSSLWLSLERISPRLAGLKHTQIAMPGVSSSSQVVTIQGLHDVVQILPTKTKPKKLIFIGSDGQKYSYLFKGLEDLHLDERIMQLIAIVNNMFAKTNRGDVERFRARHYSVTPLGSRSGLIQWVDGATPLFSLYKRWQQREALAQQIKLQQQSGSTSSSSSATPMPVIPRPSEIFYGKLTPALKEKGITNLENRKEWPLSVLRQVLQSIMAETPADLLAKELWCSSSSPDEWWQVTQTYTRSTAVMSMIGYIIGLGDRHLDNVLVDLATGEVVHIDYNVCFEKGKGLRVPEKVPFRITQNIEGALGLTGVEGLFRLSCEHVLKTLRKGRETLLTLLEAFVYDPLVDWTTGNEAGYTGAFYGGVQAWAGGDGGGLHSKRDMEREITQSMLSIRVAEMKTAWTRNKTSMLEALDPLESSVEVLVACEAKDVDRLNQRDELQELQSHIEEAVGDPEHTLYQLAPRYEEHSLVVSSRQEAETALMEKLQGFQHWHDAHQGALLSLQSGRLQKLFSEASQPIRPATATFAPILEFLEGAGQGQTAIQCEQVDGELSTSLLQLRALIHSCLDALHTYTTIIAQFPGSYQTDTHSSHWTSWLQALAQDLTKDKCQWALEQYRTTYVSGLAAADPIGLVEMESKLQAQIRDCQARVTKLVQRRGTEIQETSSLAVKAQEAASHATKFMQDEHESGVICVTGVVISHLCGMAKRYLIMEAAAAAARDQLVDLTSRDGDWFLDELRSMVGNMTHLLGQLPERGGILSEDRGHQVSQVMTATRGVFEALQDLQTNFTSIILPESLKTVSQREPSVLAALVALEHIMVGAQRPMAELLRQLEAELLEAIMGIQAGPSETLVLVRGMQAQFSALLQTTEGADMAASLTPGQMLLMGFHGLFTRLEGDMATLLEAHAALAPPESWRKLDLVAEARSMQLSAFTSSTSGFLAAIFFLRELQAMTSFFQMCRTTVQVLHGTSSGVIYDEEQMTKPIKRFIAEFVRKQLIGLPGQVLGHVICLYIEAMGVNVSAEVALRDVGAASKVSVEELCQKAVEGSLLGGRFTTAHLSQATTLLGQTDAAWRKADLASRLDVSLAAVRGRLQRAQLQLTRYQWLHEEAFLTAGRLPAQMASPTRSAIMAEINKGAQSLAAHEAMVNEVQQRHLTLETTTTQRLKWGAGANPTLAATLHQFEAALEAKNALIRNESTVSVEVQSLCSTIVHLESQRQRSASSGAEDEACLQLITRCEETCEMLEACESTITPLEEKIMKLKPLQSGETVDGPWLQSVVESSQKEIVTIEEAMADAQTDTQKAQEAVKQKVANIRGLLTSHHKLMSDVRNILKTMAKQEEQEFGTSVNAGGVRAYMGTYKSFSESLTGMLQLVLAENLAPQVANDVHEGIEQLRQQIHVIYDQLVGFAPGLLESGTDKQKGSVATAAVGAGGGEAEVAAAGLVPGSPRRKALSISSSSPTASASSSTTNTRGTGNKKSDKVARDPRTGKAIQERNSYAVGVWRRVKLKLDGRDPDPSKRFSVAEQVDYVIQEATNLDNLAVLYEGWTPWV